MWILAIVFAAFFGAVVLAGFALAASPRTKQIQATTARLEALTAPQSSTARENVINVRLEERLSTIEWLDDLLRKADFSGRLKLLLYQAELNWTVGRLLLTSTMLALFAGALMYARTGAFLMGFIVAVIAGWAPFLYVLRKRDARFELMRQFLPEALDLMSGAIRAGHSFSSAMAQASKESPEPIRREFRQCFDEQNYGLELRAALANLQYRMPIGEVRMIVTAVLIQAESGGNLTEILEKVAHLIRENFRLRQQVRVHTAQGRMSGWVLTIMPVVLGFLLYLINPKQMSLLWTHPTGRKCVYLALAMTTVGGICIRKIVRIRI
jgi:tight adherence protein B